LFTEAADWIKRSWTSKEKMGCTEECLVFCYFTTIYSILISGGLEAENLS